MGEGIVGERRELAGGRAGGGSLEFLLVVSVPTSCQIITVQSVLTEAFYLSFIFSL